MKIIKTILVLLLINTAVFNSQEITKSFVQVYGEGPVGRHLLGTEVKVYSKEDAVNLAKTEIEEFLSAMVYGYTFLYKIENKFTHSEGYFELTPVAKIKNIEKNTTLTQLEESRLFLRFQALYRPTDDQKTFIMGFNSSLAKYTAGEGRKNWIGEWNIRIDAYKDAIKNAILNHAKGKIKARPLYIKGRVLLKNSPIIVLDSGEWRAKVEVNLIIQEITYEELN